jgi:hypothetical protein
MKQYLLKIFLALFLSLIIISLVGSINVNALGTNEEIAVEGDSIQTHLRTNDQIMLCFHSKTKIMICTNVDLDLQVSCETLKIQEKNLIIEVIGDDDLKMYMNCTREEQQLGLLNGSIHHLRNRNTYRYLEGFCLSLYADPNGDCQCQANCTCINNGVCDCQCDCLKNCTCDNLNCDCQCKCDPNCDCICDGSCDQAFLKARLRIKVTNQNRLGEWAYYDHAQNEWLTLPTTIEDGYLTVETTELSSFTIFVPQETNGNSFLGIPISVVSISMIAIIAVIYVRKRKF